MELKNINIKIPKKLKTHLKNNSNNNAYVGSVFVDSEEIPSIFLTLHLSDLQLIDYKINEVLKPDLKYQYITDDVNHISLISIKMQYENQYQFIAHLNPNTRNVLKYIKDCIQMEKIGIHYYCYDNRYLISSFTNIVEEEMGWFKRNYEKMQFPEHPEHHYNTLSAYVSNKHDSNQKIFPFYDTKKMKVFAGESNSLTQIIFEDE